MLQLYRQWCGAPQTLYDLVRQTLRYSRDGRATGYVLNELSSAWWHPLEDVGPGLLDALDVQLGVRFTIVAVQGYATGMAATDWHADTPFDAQALLSLGATRTLGVREGSDGGEERIILRAGDLLFMPSGFQLRWQHCIYEDPGETRERCSLVFRTVSR